MNSGAGIYFDGLTSARSAVVVELAAARLQISDRDGRARAKWPYDEIESLTAPDNILRDGTKAVLEGGGLSFLFGMLLGDFVGGGAVVFAAKTLLQSSYTREAERAADAYGTDLMNKVGGDARALANILDKIGGATEPGMKILLNHPETKARVATINKSAVPASLSLFRDAGEWAALKQICVGS